MAGTDRFTRDVGLAGCAALLAAAEAGQFAVMLEKTSEIGGSTVKSAGLSESILQGGSACLSADAARRASRPTREWS